MRTLVHRRHSTRMPGAAQLSPEGIERARRIGRTSGTFDRVVTSPKPRAVETAEAMGYRVDARLEALAEMPDSVARWAERLDGPTFPALLALARRVDEVRRFAELQAGVWLDELRKVPEGGRVLMISHGGVIELGAVGALGDRVRGYGAGLDRLEGVELSETSGRWTGGHALRIEPTESGP